MGRLTSIGARVAPLSSRLKPIDVERPGARVRDEPAWRRWYKTARWQKLRMAVLIRDMFTCGMCGRIEPNTSLLVADHRRAHRGDETMFWNESNLWTLCKTPCHDSVKQREERRGER